MLLFQWIVPLLIGAVALSGLAKRVGAPYPAFLALGGAVLAILPAGPKLTLDPQLALALFVAPVLLDTAYDASLRDIRANWRPIALLVLAAVAITTGAVALAARWMLPDLPWSAAIALGAIVAPPDATAATTIIRQVRLPFRMATILEGESLLNDASALFIYRLAIGAAAAGGFGGSFLTLSLVLVLPLSILAGWLLAHAVMRLMPRIEEPAASIVMQFSTTFAIWMLAEEAQLSAVLVIVAYAVTISNRNVGRFGASMRLPSYAVWETATFVLNVLAFVLIGLQLRPILDSMGTARLASSLGFAVAILAVCIAARLGWIASYQLAWRRPFRGPGAITRPSGVPTNKAFVKGGLVVGWCGMRGIVTLAAAFALPEAFPHRDLMLLTAFVVVLGTLVLQGLTLRPLLGWAALEDDDPVGREIGTARTEVNRAAMAELAAERGPVADALRAEYAEILRLAESHPDGFAPARTEQDDLRLRTIAAARQRLYALRASGEIGNEAFTRIEFELDRAEIHASAI